MAKPAHDLAPAPSVLDKLEASSPGSREEILTHAKALETARQLKDATLTQTFLRFCRNIPRELSTAYILHPGPYGMGACAPDCVDLYNQVSAENKAEDQKENLARTADSLRFAIIHHMRTNGLHGSILGFTGDESASLKMAYPGTHRTLTGLAP